MANVLAHKTVSNTISVCTPAAQADVQASLTAIGLKQFIEQHQASLAYEQSMGWSGESLTKRIAWAQSVANFNNITMVEFQDLVACDIPSNVQYQYWLDSDSIQQSDPLRDAWNDIDKTGNISYDTAIAQTLTVNALLSHVRNIKSQLNNLNEIANSGSTTAPTSAIVTTPTTTTNSQITSLQSSLTSALAALNTANTASVAVSTDVINILQPLWSVITTASIATTTMPSTAATTITS